MQALERVADKQDPDHPMLSALALARLVNQAHGGPVVHMWDVAQMDGAAIDLFVGLAEDLPKKRARKQLLAQKFKEFEDQHPTYMKYRQRH